VERVIVGGDLKTLAAVQVEPSRLTADSFDKKGPFALVLARQLLLNEYRRRWTIRGPAIWRRHGGERCRHLRRAPSA